MVRQSEREALDEIKKTKAATLAPIPMAGMPAIQ
jgi:hypothetical protein